MRSFSSIDVYRLTPADRFIVIEVGRSAVGKCKALQGYVRSHVVLGAAADGQQSLELRRHRLERRRTCTPFTLCINTCLNTWTQRRRRISIVVELLSGLSLSGVRDIVQQLRVLYRKRRIASAV